MSIRASHLTYLSGIYCVCCKQNIVCNSFRWQFISIAKAAVSHRYPIHLHSIILFNASHHYLCVSSHDYYYDYLDGYNVKLLDVKIGRHKMEYMSRVMTLFITNAGTSAESFNEKRMALEAINTKMKREKKKNSR